MKLKLIIAIFVPLTIGMKAQARETVRKEEVDTIFAGVTAPNAPGLAVLVLKDGRTIFRSGYGVCSLRRKTKIGARTNFRLASFTKQFTAMAIMLLAHDGKLRYDQTLGGILQDFPAYGKTITVRNLLNHTSGLPDYEDLMAAVEKVKGPIWSPEHQIQDDEVLALLRQEKTGMFTPGASWSYSNSGYVVLGTIVAKVSGKTYGEFLRARIFAPLKMVHTLVYQKGKDVANRAFGHAKEMESFKETDQSATSATLGDGGIYSNLDDLAKWEDALRNHTLLSAEEMQPALSPVKLNDASQPHWPVDPNDDNLHPGQPVSYGFGWFLDPYHEHQRMWHTGSTMGFRTVIERFTEGRGLSVIVLCNRTDLEPEKLALKVADLYFTSR
jgi:CubicO group peptidase (beta-lactamase class C family)